MLSHVGIRDVSKWSEKVKKPLEELYGHKYFAETCEAWVDEIARFAEKPGGKASTVLVWSSYSSRQFWLRI